MINCRTLCYSFKTGLTLLFEPVEIYTYYEGKGTIDLNLFIQF